MVTCLPKSFGRFLFFVCGIDCHILYLICHLLLCSGRRETLIQNEVKRLLRDEFKPLQNEGIAAAYCAAVTDPTFLGILTNHTHERVMQQGFGMAATKGFRSDGRPLNAVRPIKAISPIFPDCVHGSASFSRGETQVLSTATISAPRDGMPLINPLSRPSWSDGDSTVSKDDEKIPVGSLRFLRSQAEMECKCLLSYEIF